MGPPLTLLETSSTHNNNNYKMLQQWASEGEFYIGGAGPICVLPVDVIVLNFIEPVTFV